MNYALNAPCMDAKGQPIPPVKHATYLDDVSTGDIDVEACWENTEVIIARLALQESTHWHMEVHLPDTSASGGGCYHLLRRISACIQINQETLCIQPAQDTSATPRFARKPHFCSNFIPDYRRKIKPLLRLLHHDNDGKWTLEHTALLNEFVESEGYQS